MKNNIVFCDGGLCNRLNALIFALVMKNRLEQNWSISWPTNNWCGASFENLFDSDLSVNDNNLFFYKEHEEDYCLVLHENQCDFKDQNIIFHRELQNYSDYDRIMLDSKPVFYYNNLIPSFTAISDIEDALKYLVVNNDILWKAENFCIENNVDNSTYGLHIRKTDFGNLIDESSLYQMVLDSNKRFFVCTDDKNVNDLFGALPNCSVFNKSFYPTKSKPDFSWNETITDDQKRSFSFNIERSKASIIEALVDLLILSQTTQLHTSNSTFLRMSLIFKSTNFFNPKR